MLTSNMSLTQMFKFMPSDEEMAMMDLDVVLYLRISLISLSKEDNYGFIRYFFSDAEVKNYFKDYEKTVFYDFDGTKTNQEKFVTIFELYGKSIYHETALYLEEILKGYSHEADVIIDVFTHDNHMYRLSNLEGIVKVEEVKRV